MAIYHCQQAAEKAVKGFLVWRDVPFPKTHDVRLRVQMAVSINPDFSIHEDAADILTPYATEFRYPGEVMEPTDDEMEEALNHEENVVCFVISLLPEALKNILTSHDIHYEQK